ncbi:MAG: endolytic transglycosylase MltG [Desulfobacteraceae bacterium]|nr:endolytic transglycosylase MltG [Desulfobacteraceae bacterium]
MKIIKYIFIGLLILSLGSGAWLAANMYHFAHNCHETNESLIVIDLASGDSLKKISNTLESTQIISDSLKFRLLARITGDDKRLKAGEYKLSSGMSPMQILDLFVNGNVLLHVLTIPEGYTFKQIGQLLNHLDLTNGDDFVKTAAAAETVQSFHLEGETMEGYLFPDTYHFPKGLPPKKIISLMVARFEEHFSQQWRLRAEELGFSLQQIVILASMIEKETGAPSERKIISSVFHNRLKKKIRLASDPTVIYGIKDFDGNIKRKHLTAYSPYNTYVIKGLPAGPIANPGRASLEAALFPDKTDFLYFVSKNDGAHHFSKDIEEHNAAVRKYQLRPKRKK